MTDPFEVVRASFAQEGLWFVDQLAPGMSTYHVPLFVRLRGSLDRAALAASLDDIAARHEALRTSFALEGGRLVQHVHADGALALALEALPPHGDVDAAIADRLRELLKRPFDLHRAPVARASLIEVGPDDHVLALIVHHMVWDGASEPIVARDLATAYAARCDGRAPVWPASALQLADFSAWQREAFETGALDDQRAYWKRQLAGAPETLGAPTDFARPAVARFRGARESVVVPRELATAANSFARDTGTTLLAVVLAAYAEVLRRFTRQRDVVIGVPAENRQRAGADAVVGFVANMLPIRVSPGRLASFRELVRDVRATVVDAMDHQDLPFERLVEDLSPSRNLGTHPIFQTALVTIDVDARRLALAGLVTEPVAMVPDTAKFDVSLQLVHERGAWSLVLEYDVDLFHRATARQLLGCLEAVLSGALAHPDQPIGELASLSPVARAVALELGVPASPIAPASELLHERFAAQVRRAPDAPAVTFGDTTLSYAELDARSNQLAIRLRRAGVDLESPVGILLERSLELAVAILAIVKAGGCYVPVDPRYPDDRIAFTFEDAAAQVVVTSTELASKVPARATAVCVDVATAEEPAPVAPVALRPGHAAYIIYTSGSTGRPKGVVVSHANACGLFDALGPEVGICSDDVWTLFHSATFDFSVWELWGALLYGGRVVVVPYWVTRSAAELCTLLLDQRVTVLSQTPSAFEQLVAVEATRPERLPALRLVCIAGESLKPDSMRRWFSRHGDQTPIVINLYGITETTVMNTFCRVTLDDVSERVPRSRIGRPIRDCQLYVLDEALEPVPPGFPGEFYLGGPALARGYLHRPELTAERFIANPHSLAPGARLYRTGDLGRWRHDGDLEYLGRADQQVKLRGYRIELGEIEDTLTRHPAIAAAAVVAREDAPGQPRLVGYLVQREGDPVDVAEVRDFARRSLADYMVPSTWMVVPALPLMVSGKVDRRALPAPVAIATAAPDEPEPSLTPTEQLVGELWTSVLGCARVRRTDDFFELGGNSLLAMQVTARVREMIGIQLSVRSLFEHPTAQRYAHVIATLRSISASQAPNFAVVSRAQPLPLSYAQERLWFIHKLAPDSAAYNIASATRLTGPVDLEALHASFQWLVARHEPLRTRFVEVDDRPIQCIDAARSIAMPVIDLTATPDADARVRDLATIEAQTPFDLGVDLMMRVRVLRLGPEDHVLLVTVHHIAGDGWGFQVLLRDLEVAYTARRSGALPELPPLELQYADFAVWQREWLAGPVRDAQLAYWRAQLAGMPATLGLPTDFTRPAVQSFSGEHLSLTLLDDAAPVRALCRELGATLFMVLLAAFDALLARYTGGTDIVVGTPIAGRVRTEIEPLVGFFVNTLVMRTDVAGDPSLCELIARVRQTALGAYQHEDLPFEILVDSLAPERDAALATPLFEVLFHVRDFAASHTGITLPGTTGTRLDIESGTAQFDLGVDIDDVDGRLELRADYNTDLFRGDSIRRLMEHFRALLAAALARPDAPISQLSLLSDAERRRAIDVWSRAEPLAEPPRSVHAWFEDVARARPDAVAVIADDEVLTYGELADRSRSLAHRLAHAGVGRETRVGLCLPRSVGFVEGMLGIVGAGGVFVPADPSTALPRTIAVLRDAGATAIVTTSQLAPALAEVGATIVCIDADAPTPAAAPSLASVDLDHLAYITYTSGSTGTPKGVMITHRGLWTRLAGGLAALPITGTDAVLQAAAISFDVSIWECFAALVSGARLVIVKDGGATDPEYLRSLLIRHEVTVATLGASLLAVLLDEGTFAGNAWLRDISTGGEVFSVELLQRLHAELPRAQVSNHYGATEASIDTTVWTARRGEALRTVPIGRPMRNTRVYVLDRELQPVPIGVVGEIFIGGGGLARGYHARPELTAAAFVPDPFATTPGDRLYRTGDLGRQRSDGALEFVGRDDLQIKVRGVRVELGEVEAVVLAHPTVRDSVVIASGEDARDRRLVAFVVPATGDAAAELVADRVDAWREVHDDVMFGEATEPGRAEFKITGWNSSYTGGRLADEDMREWVDATVALVEAQRPRRVLEIGTGNGLLLFRLAPGCEHYCATDISPHALAHIRETMATCELAAPVTLLEREATDFADVPARSFDCVVISSVAQYFPSLDYLVEVLEGACAALDVGGSVVLADMRHLHLMETFHASVQLYRAPRTATCDQVRARVHKALFEEPELAIDPQLFHQLRTRIPRIAGVEVRLRSGRCPNEMTKYRYDVVLRLDAAISHARVPREHVWGATVATLASLEAELGSPGVDALRLRGIPNDRIAVDVTARDLLAREGRTVTAAEIRAQAAAAGAPLALDPEAIAALADRLGYRCVLDWTRGDAARFDALMWRAHVPQPAPELPLERDVEWARLTNDPLRARRADAAIPALRAFVAERLPRAMQPQAYVMLGGLPQTPNGKVDRAVLASLVGERDDQVELVEPRTPTEQRLAALWQQVLGVTRVSVHASFFELGGHSLLGTQLVSRVRKTFHVDLKLTALFECADLAALAARIDELRDSTRPWQRAPIPRVLRADAPPLSFAQQRLWFLDQLAGASTTNYNVTGALRMTGALDAVALELAITEIVRRHESLRTCFHSVDGRPVQVIQPPARVALTLEDLQALSPEDREATVRMRGAEVARRPFDLGRDLMIRTDLLRLDSEHHVFLLSMHHIASDGWSIWILFRELTELYDAYTTRRGARLRELPIQYSDFARWQRALLSGPTLEAELGYWRDQLSGGARPVTLPTDFRRPQLETFAGQMLRFTIPRELTAAVKRFAASEGATDFMALLAAFDMLLARHTGQTDLVVGSPIANRNHADTEGLIGFFVNTLALRTDLSGDPSLRELIARVRHTCLGAYAHQDVPFEKIVEDVQPERDLSRNPIFQVMFALQNAPSADLALNGVAVEPLPLDYGTSKFDLWVSLEERDGELVGGAEYNVDLYRAETVSAMIAQYVDLLRSAVSRPDVPMSRLPFHATTSGEPLAASLGPVVPELGLFVPEQIARVAAQQPDAVAVRFEGAALTYRELDARANQLARRLQRLGIGPEVVVALLLERSLDLVVSILAVLKAGGAYLPLDTQAPASRNAFMVGDAGAAVVVTESDLLAALDPVACPVVVLDRERDAIAAEPTAAVQVASTPGSMVYVIYTSGSTGTPKGVINVHAGLRNRLRWMQGAYGLTAADRVLQKTPYTFDVSVWEFLWPLAVGATIVLARPDGHRDATYLAELIADERVTVTHFVPSMFHAFLDQVEAMPPTALRLIVSSGEVLSVELAARAHARLPEVELHNLYGPTEASIDVTAWPCAPGRDRTVPIGRPIDNTQIYIVDETLAIVPPGVRGEICIGGVQVARGYVARPELTADRFVPDPFAAIAGQRMYRTGDVGRFRSDGSIEYVERLDSQVKLRGLRIELGEIEAALTGHPAVGEAVAMVRDASGSDQQLVAYVVPAGDADVTALVAEALPLESGWRSTFDETYARQDAGEAADFNTVGWTSSYSGARIADVEMREWVDTTVERIRALEPRSILELGCGTGLLVTRLLATVERYIAVDFSRQALDAVARAVAGRPEADRLEYLERAADDLIGFPAGSVDIVVINSAMQYFPDASYACRVIEQAVAATRPGGAIFIGDVRDLGLLEAFHASVELAHAPRTMTVAELRERVRQRAFADHELALDPRFFAACAASMPRIAGVRAQLKASRHATEMTRFRNDVTLFLDRVPAPTALDSTSWSELGGTLDAFAIHLTQRAPAALEVRGIANSRVAAALAVVDRLAGAAIGHVGALRAAAAHGAIDPMAVVDRAAALGYDVELAWSEEPGRFDAVITRPGTRAVPLVRPPADGTRALARWANDPARARASRQLAPMLRAHLKQRLPAYMVPSAFVVLEAIPLTRSGKVDRKALPEPGTARPELVSTWVPPRSPAEQTLAAIWSELLDVERVGVHDNFFDLGGDSILSIQVVARANQAGLRLKPRDLFQHPTIAECVAIAAASAGEAPTSGARGPAPDDYLEQARAQLGGGRAAELEDAYPLTPLQEQMLRELVEDPEPGLNLVHLAIDLTDPELDTGAFEQAWQTVVDRHANLRVSMLWQGVARPLQLVHRRVAVRLVELDWRALSETERTRASAHYIDELRGNGFTPSEAPLFHVALARLDADRYRLLWCYSYLLQDGWSRELLLGELVQAYDAIASGQAVALPAPAPHGNYVRWLLQQDASAARQFWQRELVGVTDRTPLPLARLRLPGATEPRSAALDVALPESTSRRLAELLRAQQLTLNTVAHAAFGVLLASHAHRTDVVFGTMLSDRPTALPGVEAMQGSFLNIVPARIRFDRTARVASWLRELQAHQAEVREYGFSSPGAPLFDSYVVVQNLPVDSVMRARLRQWQVGMDGHVQTRHPLALMVFPGATTWLSLTYKPSHYLAADVDRLMKELLAIVDAIVDPLVTCVGGVLDALRGTWSPAVLPHGAAAAAREEEL